ncbi:hypothetical protein D9M68_385390 [compost metagenome]
MGRIRTRRYCVVPHSDGVVVGGLRRIPDGNTTSTAGRRTDPGRQRVDTGRTVVIVVDAHRAVVVDAVVVSLRGLHGFQLGHVHGIGVGRPRRDSRDLPEFLVDGGSVANTHRASRALGGIDRRLLSNRCTTGHIAGHVAGRAGNREAAKRNAIIHAIIHLGLVTQRHGTITTPICHGANADLAQIAGARRVLSCILANRDRVVRLRLSVVTHCDTVCGGGIGSRT